MAKILIVEDESKIARFVELELKYEGYEVEIAADGRSGLEKALQKDVDLVLLDIMLPGISGIEVCRRIRTESGVPIIMLTAKDDVTDKVAGLDMGADDYMTKPFGVMELAARIRSLLRRSTKNQGSEDELEQYCLNLNKKTREVYCDGVKVELTLKEFELLQYLMENHNKVVTRDELLNHIWGYDYDGETRTLDMHIRTLRQKLGENGGSCIKTVRGVGYRFIKTEE